MTGPGYGREQGWPVAGPWLGCLRGDTVRLRVPGGGSRALSHMAVQKAASSGPTLPSGCGPHGLPLAEIFPIHKDKNPIRPAVPSPLCTIGHSVR